MECVGKTDRNLEERIAEHATKHNQPSAVYNHINYCDHFQYLYKIMSFPKLFQDNIWTKDLSFYREFCINAVTRINHNIRFC